VERTTFREAFRGEQRFKREFENKKVRSEKRGMERKKKTVVPAMPISSKKKPRKDLWVRRKK